MRQHVKKQVHHPNGESNGITKMAAAVAGAWGSGHVVSQALGMFMLFYSTNKVFTWTRHVQTTTNTTLTPKDPHHLQDTSMCLKTSPPSQWQVQWYHENGSSSRQQQQQGLGAWDALRLEHLVCCFFTIIYVYFTLLMKYLHGLDTYRPPPTSP